MVRGGLVGGLTVGAAGAGGYPRNFGGIDKGLSEEVYLATCRPLGGDGGCMVGTSESGSYITCAAGGVLRTRIEIEKGSSGPVSSRESKSTKLVFQLLQLLHDISVEACLQFRITEVLSTAKVAMQALVDDFPIRGTHFPADGGCESLGGKELRISVFSISSVRRTFQTL